MFESTYGCPRKRGPSEPAGCWQTQEKEIRSFSAFLHRRQTRLESQFCSGTQKKKPHKSEQLQWKTSEHFDRGFLAWLQPTGVGGVSTSHQAGANQKARAAAFIVPDSHFGQTGIRGNVSWDQPILCKITPADAFFIKALFQKYWLINLSQAHSSVFLLRRLRYSPHKSNILKSRNFFLML